MLSTTTHINDCTTIVYRKHFWGYFLIQLMITLFPTIKVFYPIFFFLNKSWILDKIVDFYFIDSKK